MKHIVPLLAVLCVLGCSCVSCVTAPPVATNEIPLLESEQTSLLSPRETKVTFRASAKKCAVYLNGEYQGNTLLTLSALAPGLYHLRVEKKGYKAADYMIEVKLGSHEFYYVQLEDEAPLEEQTSATTAHASPAAASIYGARVFD